MKPEGSGRGNAWAKVTPASSSVRSVRCGSGFGIKGFKVHSLRFKFQAYVLGVMIYDLCFMLYALCFMLYALCFMFYVAISCFCLFYAWCRVQG